MTRRSEPARLPGTPSRGSEGEAIAARFLETRDFRILERNYRRRGGEVDLVAEDGDALVFIEVKSGQSESNFGGPLGRVTPEKRRRLVRTAERYLADHPREGGDVRFDVVTVVFRRGGSFRIRHLADAFRPEAE